MVLVKRNIKIIIEYDGTDYVGWQKQPISHGPSIQETIEKALEKITQHQVALNGAGRTDSGVHAKGQVANFFTWSGIPAERLPRALAGILPRDVVVKEAWEVPEDFHARYSALEKTYRYTIRYAKSPSAFQWRYSYHVHYPLNVDAMKKGASFLIGTYDYRSFCAKGSSVKKFVRTVKDLVLYTDPENLYIEVTADGLLYNMVRIIVGTLVEVGRGRWNPEKVKDILEAKDRRQAGPTMRPEGLALLNVKYK
jgi:tRNA pseudouridine38-40 synthase